MEGWVLQLKIQYNNLTDEQIKNTNSPFNLFTGSYYYKQFTEGEIDDIEGIGTLEEIYTKLNISN